MIGPQHLHAYANLWSLHAIWPQLAQAARNATEAADPDRGTVQAWRPGSGVHSGRTSDQILDAIVRNDDIPANPYADRLDRGLATLFWVTKRLGLPLPHHQDAIVETLLEALPDLRPAAALDLALWVGAEDRAIRNLLREPTDHQPLSGLRCPYCDKAGTLALRSSPPPLQRPTICTAGCTCDGTGCTCGMAATVEGLPHIWTHDQLAAALDQRDAA